MLLTLVVMVSVSQSRVSEYRPAQCAEVSKLHLIFRLAQEQCIARHGMGFRTRAAASNPYIIKCNAKSRMQCKAHHHWQVVPLLWSSGDVFSVVTSHFSVWQSDGGVQVWQLPGEQYLFDCIEPSVNGDYGVGLFFGCWARPLSSSERNS